MEKLWLDQVENRLQEYIAKDSELVVEFLLEDINNLKMQVFTLGQHILEKDDYFELDVDVQEIIKNNFESVTIEEGDDDGNNEN